jgi:hypothetical protein
MRAALSPDDILRRWDDMPTMGQAGVYSGVTHNLRAIEAAGTDEAKSVVAQMKATPVNDFFAHDGRIREDGRMIHDMYLVQVKSPSDSKSEWDIYKVLATVPGMTRFGHSPREDARWCSNGSCRVGSSSVRGQERGRRALAPAAPYTV